ncbi:hypothetical protein VTJ83DRAFT_5606 [Remersonia thermophila]|uniref:Glycosylphosphatidylinositol anchor biosynthesis protein 11 n=1 Tax=Remersonia thermophila TaxID=72144 RepID=A0ABR4D897_9PEZI
MPSTPAKGAAATAALSKSNKPTPSPQPAQPPSLSPPPSDEKPQPPLRPVQTKPTQLARTARHALPALQAALFLARFRALVADPVAEMSMTLPVTAALQVTYALACLPVAGSSGGKGGDEAAAAGAGAGKKTATATATATAMPARLGSGKRKAAAAADGGMRKGATTAVLSLLLSALVTPFLYITMILFGAPFLTHGSHTLLCAAHMAVLALFPLFFVRGVDGRAWAALGGFAAPLDDTFGGLVGAVVGAWLGAVPIPLDWDRDWQRWPVTILAGLYAGYLLGRVVGGTVAWGKKF